MSTIPGGPSCSGQTTPQLSPIHSHFDMKPPRRGSPRDGPLNAPVSLPPLRQLSGTPPVDKRYVDPFRSILNPQAELYEQQHDRRRSTSQMDSPSPVDTHHSHSLPSVSRPTSVEFSQDEQHPLRPFHPPGRPLARTVLTPKSPRLHRTQSLGLFNPPTGTIDAHQTPFLTASTRPSEPVTSQPSLPTPPAGNRPAYLATVNTTAPTQPPNMVRAEMRRPSIGFPQSGSASPIAQYSPYSQPASVASSQFDQNTAGQHMLSHSNIQMHDARHSAGNTGRERNMIPMAPSGQSSIQLRTIITQQGHNVQIPVDVQAASKVADEKRRRNAGASARFRARRKEKEREASMSISRLEQQLRNALEDSEYYRVERDYFKAIVFQQPHAEDHYGRPPSPRLRRSSLPSYAPSSTRGGSVDSYADYEEEHREEERNVRRRTSNYYPVSGPPPTELVATGSVSHSFAVPPLQGTPHSQPHLSHEPAHATGSHPTRPERSSYRDTFTSDASQYEHGAWTPVHTQQRGN
jgi:hypothetical protein